VSSPPTTQTQTPILNPNPNLPSRADSKLYSCKFSRNSLQSPPTICAPAHPQVCDLYLTHLTAAQKITLFYGTLNHFLILYISDRAVVIFTAMWVLPEAIPFPHCPHTVSQSAAHRGSFHRRPPHPETEEGVGPAGFQVAEIDPNIIASLGSSAGAAWILPLGVLNALPMILARAGLSMGSRGGRRVLGAVIGSSVALKGFGLFSATQASTKVFVFKTYTNAFFNEDDAYPQARLGGRAARP